MLELNQVEGIIYTALSSLNEELADDKKILLNQETVLFGRGSLIDSLALVSVVVDIETALSAEHNLDVSLTDDRAMSREISPFSTVATLRDYIFEVISG